MASAETLKLGQMVVDFFTTQSHNSWEEAETLEDLEPGLQVVRVLIRMGRHADAINAGYQSDLFSASIHNLGAEAESQALLKPLFPDGWDHDPVQLDEFHLSALLTDAALSLREGFPEQAKKLNERSMLLDISQSATSNVTVSLSDLAELAFEGNRLAEMGGLVSLELELAEAMEGDDEVFYSKVDLFRYPSNVGIGREIISGGSSTTCRVRRIDSFTGPATWSNIALKIFIIGAS